MGGSVAACAAAAMSLLNAGALAIGSTVGDRCEVDGAHGMKALVVYHSRSGTTRRVARLLAGRLQADLEEIVPLQPHAGDGAGYAQCLLESLAALTPAILPPARDPRRYGLVVVGTPIWCWSLCGPVRTWLMQQRDALARVRLGLFCTMGGSGASLAFERMETLAGRESAARLALTDRQVAQGAAGEIDAFVGALQGPRAGRSRRPSAARARAVAG